MHILRANTESGGISYEEVPANWKPYGGRALVARFLLDEVPPTCDPLGSSNKLVFAPGLLTGHMLSSVDRISVGGKSPLTGGIKESNAGGSTGMRMAWLRLFALIIEGDAPSDDGWQYLYIGRDKAVFEDAGDLVGMNLPELAVALRERYDDRISISAIGTAGERLYHSAGITHLDKDRNLTRISARGGLGAVMGSKRLKAVVFDHPRANQPELMDKAAFKDASTRYLKGLQTIPQTAEIYPKYGTAGMVAMCNAYGGMPTRNFSQGSFEDADAISGERIKKLNESRGGQTTHACMAGCIIRCSNEYVDENGELIVTPLEYETIGLMGSNLGLAHPDHIAVLNAIANEIGVDTIEVGAALGVAAEAGLMEFGDNKRARELMLEVAHGTPLGRIIGAGAVAAGKVLGVTRVPAVKGQAMSAYDPRAIKGTGVTYATSAQGADHTSGLTIRADVDHTDPEGQVELSRAVQFNMAAYDALGVCIFGGSAMPADIARDLMVARYGWHISEDYFVELGKETILMEREFNRLAGFTKVDDRLPEWMMREPLSPTNAVFDVPEAEIDAIFE